MSTPTTIDRATATAGAAAILEAAGVGSDDAGLVADALVDADARGLASHGLMLLPMYVARLRQGSVDGTARPLVVHETAATAALDAGHGLGQVSGDHAMRLAVDKARQVGVGVVTVRRAFHYGGGYRYVGHAVRQDCIGIAAANTRPMMPAPGGAVPVVGNNPLAIGAPTDGEPLILDMALSEVALGKIRLAAQEGTAIPPTWATDDAGVPTTDPVAAIAGMLLPAGGVKGFGLALMVDVLTGVLSGGGFGASVRGLYADVGRPNDSAHLFVAIDVRAFGDAAAFRTRAGALAREIEASPTVAGSAPVRLPGTASAARSRESASAGIPLAPSVVDGVHDLAGELAVALPEGWR